MFVLAKEKSGEVNCEHIYYLCNLLLKTTASKQQQQQQKSPIEKMTGDEQTVQCS